MSGGAFDYIQFRFNDIITEIEKVIQKERNPVEDHIPNPYDWREYEEDFRYGFSEETLEKFEEAIKTIKKAEIMATRVDWLLSGDDGEDSFHKRWKEELE